MSDQACKSEEQHRIDTLQEMANTEHQLRMARTQYEAAKGELVRASEALLEWQEQWNKERRAVFACYPDAMPVDSVVEDARATMDRFCAEVNARNAALTPAPAPVEIEIPAGFTKWEGGVYGDFVRDNPSMDRVSTELEVILRDGTQCKGLPGGFIWNHEGVWNDIIAYRTIEAAPADEQDDASEFAEPMPDAEFVALDEQTCKPLDADLAQILHDNMDQLLITDEAPALNEAMQDEREEPVHIGHTPFKGWDTPSSADSEPPTDPEGYAPVTNPEADALARAHDYYSPEKVAERNKFNPFSIFRREDA